MTKEERLKLRLERTKKELAIYKKALDLSCKIYCLTDIWLSRDTKNQTYIDYFIECAKEDLGYGDIQQEI